MIGTFKLIEKACVSLVQTLAFTMSAPPPCGSRLSQSDRRLRSKLTRTELCFSKSTDVCLGVKVMTISSDNPNSPPRGWPDPPPQTATERIASSLQTLRDWESTTGFFQPGYLTVKIAIKVAREALTELEGSLS